MTCPLPPYLERVKLTSELLMAFKRLLPNYTGIERKRIERRIVEMEAYLKTARRLGVGEGVYG